MYVAVVGPGDDATAADLERAREVGRLLAGAGAVVVTGGLGGVMAAAIKGASGAGGTTLALLPGDSRAAAGAPATVVVATGLGEGRNAVLVRTVDAVIAVGGSWGTLSEIALARRAGVPVVCLGRWSVLDAGGRPLALDRAADPAEAVAAVLNRRRPS
ncbi:MAG: hypothetical protein ABR571_04475 [Jatrophihabitans sp.]|uniref:SLOG cluster 4 domain-containing protein n=1 Tax=Jatrophihabitans sp. TaxID=1932789 RepID=UPI00391088E4